MNVVGERFRCLKPHSRVARKQLLPTDDPEVFYLPLAEDSFVHFTTQRRAEQIVASGKLLMRPPYQKFGTDSVDAVSAVWGWFVPGVQTRHLKKYEADEGGLVAVLFKTSLLPEVGFVEEVKWHQDVPLRRAVIVSAPKAIAMLQRTPLRLKDDQQRVVWQRPESVRTARAIRLDKPGIRELAKELEIKLAQALEGREGPLGKKNLGQFSFEIRAVDGSRVKLWVRLQAIPTSDFRYYVSGGLGKSTQRGQTVVVVFINGSLDAQVIWKGTNAGTTHGMLYPILLHELTHAADIFAPVLGMSEDAARDNAAYYNHPSELRAYMQEVVDEVEQRFRHYEKLKSRFGNRALDMLLNMSTTWKEVSPHWTVANRQKVLKAVYQALETWQEDQAARLVTAFVMPQRVATRYRLARGELGPIVKALAAGRFDVSQVERALEELEVRRNGERWSVDADWFSALGPRHQKRALTVIRALGRLVREPEAASSDLMGQLAFELGWLQRLINNADAKTFQHGVFEIVPHGVTGPAVRSCLDALDRAYKVIQPKFPEVLYGRVYVVKNLSGHATVASYQESGDVVYLSLKAKGSVGDVYALCHELGHRYFFKFWKDKAQRAEFMRLSTTAEYREIVFDRGVRQAIATEYIDVARARRDGEPQPTPSELFLLWMSETHGTPAGTAARKLGVQLVKGEDVEAALHDAIVGGKDFTVRTRDIVREPEYVTTYGRKSWVENFAEAFAHQVLGMKMPPGVAAIMGSLS